MRKGFWFGVAAYVWWGLTPLFWNLVDDVGPIHLLGSRIVWSIPVLAVILGTQRRFREFRTAFVDRHVLATTALAAILLCINWGVWLYAVTSGQIVEASLGYFIIPLVSVALGVIVLRERLRPAQWTAVGIAAVGVVGMTISLGSLPWVACVLAVSFGSYGLIKKAGDLPAPLISLSGEVLILAIPAVLGLTMFSTPTDPTMTDGPLIVAFLIGTGVVTTVPLLLFGAAAKRIPLTTLGIIQYVAPSIQFALGVVVYGEDLGAERLVWFIIVWAALVVFVADGYRHRDTAVRGVAAARG
ncbi:MAG: EamA family transporter RarD [Acidimicrobiia bacterium]|nr:EamA family transporter RarD [Acidimicrobiia bacterium]